MFDRVLNPVIMRPGTVKKVQKMCKLCDRPLEIC